MKKITITLILLVSTYIITWYSCNKKEQAVSPPLPGNEQLTTMVLIAINPNDATDTPTAKWIQLDPNGSAAGMDLSHDTLNLKNNVAYNVQIKVLDTLTDVTPEILARENYHLFCFNDTGGLGLTVVQTDHDTNPQKYPVGLTDLFTTQNSASNGVLEVTLHHQPNVKNGSCSPGSVDMDCTFIVNIK